MGEGDRYIVTVHRAEGDSVAHMRRLDIEHGHHAALLGMILDLRIGESVTIAPEGVEVDK